MDDGYDERDGTGRCDGTVRMTSRDGWRYGTDDGRDGTDGYGPDDDEHGKYGTVTTVDGDDGATAGRDDDGYGTVRDEYG